MVAGYKAGDGCSVSKGLPFYLLRLVLVIPGLEKGIC
jgi:hypothetical protein